MKLNQKKVNLFISLVLLIVSFIFLFTIPFYTMSSTFNHFKLLFLDVSFGVEFSLLELGWGDGISIQIANFSIINSLVFVILAISILLLIIRVIFSPKILGKKIESLFLSLLIIIASFIILFSLEFSNLEFTVNIDTITKEPMLFMTFILVLLSGLNILITDFLKK